jgi:hypothetical protein
MARREIPDLIASSDRMVQETRALLRTIRRSIAETRRTIAISSQCARTALDDAVAEERPPMSSRKVF